MKEPITRRIAHTPDRPPSRCRGCGRYGHRHHNVEDEARIYEFLAGNWHSDCYHRAGSPLTVYHIKLSPAQRRRIDRESRS